MKLFAASIMLLCMLLPQAAGAVPAVSSNPGAVERSVPPRVTGPLPDFKLPELREFHLDNGIPVYTAVQPELPYESICILFPQAGAKNDPVGKYGLYCYVNNLLAKGTKTRGCDELEKEFLSLGAQFSSYGGSWNDIDWDVSGGRVDVVRLEHLPEIIRLFADAVLQPAFSQQELERLKSSRWGILTGLRTSPLFLGEAAFNRFVFGEDSRYGTSLRADTSAQEATITREDILAFYKKHYTPKQAFFLCRGPLELDELAKHLNKHFGGWQDSIDSESVQKEIPSESLKKCATAAFNTEPRYIPVMAPGASTLMDGRILIVDRPEAKSARIWVGCRGISAADPDLLAIQAMNTILGDCGVGDHLNANLRESKGYSYGVRSTFDCHLDRGAFKVTGAIQIDKAIPAVQEIFKEMAVMRQPLPEAELRKYLTYMAYSYPRKFDGSHLYLDSLVKMLLGYYTKEYVDTYVSKVLKLAPEDIQKAAERTLDTDKMIVVIVGDAKALEPQLKEAGWRAQVVTVDEVLGPEVQPER
ncbi:MAG: pitrilysin family protein [bacterium]|nr:pitrilysin family protein [bacterium]